MADISQNSVTIEAPVAEVQALLSDLAGYPAWSTAIKSVDVLESDAQSRPTKVKIAIDAGVMKDRVTLDYDWSKAPASISFSLDEADLLTGMDGVYTIKAIDEDTTEVTYELEVALSMPIPAMMRQKAEKSTIDAALSQLKSALEG